MDVALSTNYEPIAAAPAPSPAPAPVGTSPASESSERTVERTPERIPESSAERHATPEEKEKPAPSMEVIERIIEQMNKSLTNYGREMHISIHEKTQRLLVKVMDTVENKVIRELPPEKVLDAFAVTLELAGILLDKKM